MNQDIFYWILLLVRWLHITVAVTWIGTSIFFMWLDRSFDEESGAYHVGLGVRIVVVRAQQQLVAAGRQYLLQQRIHSGESISKELFKNALSLAAGRGLLADPGPDPDAVANIARKRDAFAAELREVVDRIDSLRRLAGAALERTTAEEGPE